MVNNFHIEIIRQFEIQKTSMETLVQDYLLDEDDNISLNDIFRIDIYIGVYNKVPCSQY